VDFSLTDEHREWQARCRRFAAEAIRPVAAELDREERFPWEVLRAAREAGLYDGGLLMRWAADEHGLMAAIYAEEMHWGCAGVALALGASTGVAAAIAGQGTPEQVEEWLPLLYGEGDEVNVAAYAVTEAQAGSDVSAIRTTARPDGDGWVLDGEKVMIGNAGIAEASLVVATVDPSLGHRAQASFLVRRGTPGLEHGRPYSKLGVRASCTSEIVLRGCRVPGDALLGGREALEGRLERARERARDGGSAAPRAGGGSSRVLALAEITRPLFAAGAVGIGRAALEWAIERLESLPEADRRLADEVVADVATELEAARLLAWRAASLARRGVPLTGAQGSMSKLKASEVAVWAAGALMDAVGPAAASADCPLGKHLRDAKVFEIFEGTSQVQRTVIARLQRELHAGAA
jgi:alkylation response protein AidB-like acyl-CoA dehydrogenase